MEKNKLTRQERAKQFAPFDALKGLQEALRLKEYQHEKIEKGDLQEEKAKEISSALINIQRNDVAFVKYFCDGHVFSERGTIKIKIESGEIEINNKRIKIENLLNIKVEKWLSEIVWHFLKILLTFF